VPYAPKTGEAAPTAQAAPVGAAAGPTTGSCPGPGRPMSEDD
jgi:hypothetical protein